MARKQRRKEGDIVEIPVAERRIGYGRVLRNPLFAFYEIDTPSPLPVRQILGSRILFKVWVMKYAVSDGIWKVVGNEDLEAQLLDEPSFFKSDPISGKLFLTKTGAEEVPATKEECEGLECAAVWDPDHVAERIRDHFDGRPNKWVESMKL